MSTSNVDAIYAEYPFLKMYRPRVRVAAGRIERWDEEMLSKTANHIIDGGGDGNFRITYGKFYLIDAEGKEIARVGEFLTKAQKRKGWFWTYDVPPHWRSIYDENLGQTLARIGDSARHIRYAAFFEDARNILTFYKLPKGFDNASDWLQAIIAEGQEEIRAIE